MEHLSQRRGAFLVLEGIDGSGTTTQAARLRAHLEGRGHTVHATAEPSQGPIGKEIRRVLRGEPRIGDAALALLFAADRLDHLEREVEPALGRGAVVLSDRYVMSSLAYQALAVPIEWVAAINDRAPRADATFYLRVSAETAGRRRAARGGAAEKWEDDPTQARIAANYERALAARLVSPVTVIDAERGLDEVTAALCRAADEALAAS